MTANGSNEPIDYDLDQALSSSVAQAYREVPVDKPRLWIRIAIILLILIALALVAFNSLFPVYSIHRFNKLQTCQIQDSSNRAQLAAQDRASVEDGFKIQDQIFAELNHALFDVKASQADRAAEFKAAFVNYANARAEYTKKRTATEKARAELPTVSVCSK